MLTLQISAFAFYLAALLGLWRTSSPKQVIAAAWAAGCLVQAWSLLNPLWHGEHLVFALFSALALTALLINALVLIWTWFRPAWHLGLVTLPCALAAVWVDSATATQAEPLIWTVHTHIFISLLAYGVLTLAGAQAVLLLLKERSLGPQRITGSLARLLPPLDRMDALLVEIIVFGLIFLSVGLAIGGFALTELVPGILHKAVFSCLAWLVLVVLLWGRWRFGWRGRLAASIMLSSFVLLALGFLGTKVVLEIILNRPF